MENAFRDGEVKTTGTDIDKRMPPVRGMMIAEDPVPYESRKKDF